MNTFLLRFVACLFVVISSSSHAALYDRGNGLIYDDVLDVTWMQDANYAHTSGYAAANAVGSLGSGSTNIQADGRMGWAAANAWADQLVYGGFEDWRLASVGTAPTYAGYDITSGELGHMFYINLDNLSWLQTGGACFTAPEYCLKNIYFTDGDSGDIASFLNLQSSYYWYGEEGWLGDPDDADAGGGWGFFFTEGWQFDANKVDSWYGWAVRDGDVSTVPVPAAAWLFGSALAGLLVARGKNKK